MPILLPWWDRLTLSSIWGWDELASISHTWQHHQYHWLLVIIRLTCLPIRIGGDLHQRICNNHDQDWMILSSSCSTSQLWWSLPLVCLFVSFFPTYLKTWSFLKWALYLRATVSKVPIYPPSPLKKYSCIYQTHRRPYCSCKWIGQNTRCPTPYELEITRGSEN